MRVITGTARGRKLKTLEGLDIRPTSDKVKEAIFSIVNFYLPQSTVIDLFCGSGQIGIEALSRGAKYAYFVDSNKKTCEIAKENLATVELFSNARVACMDSLDFLKSSKYQFDIAFVDPPYNVGLVEQALILLEPLMSEEGRVVCEHESKLLLPQQIGGLSIEKVYKYGKVGVTLYSRCGAAPDVQED